MRESEMWREDVRFLAEGDVLDYMGRPLRLRHLIQRRWGWPRAATEMAIPAVLRQEQPGIWVNGPLMRAQQADLIKAEPEIIPALLDGLAGKTTRESNDFGRPIEEVTVEFDSAIADEGLVTTIIHAVARRLGCASDDLRKAIGFHPVNGFSGEKITIHVPAHGTFKVQR